MSNIEKSSNWYFTVNEYCKSLEVIYNVPLIKIAGIFSALSPNNTVKTNIISLERFLLHKGNCKVTTFNGQKKLVLFSTIFFNQKLVGKLPLTFG